MHIYICLSVTYNVIAFNAGKSAISNVVILDLQRSNVHSKNAMKKNTLENTFVINQNS